jgi:uncharacterized membrane protein YvbJ
MSYCSNCGSSIDENYEFCPSCGVKVLREADNSHGHNNESHDAGTKICQNCGQIMASDAFYCIICGATYDDGQDIYDVAEKIKNNQKNGRWVGKWTAFFLCLFLGWIGVHRYYEGKIMSGIVYTFTFGLFGLGWVYDMVRILLKPNPYLAKK